MRQLYDECEVHIRNLELLGVVSEAYSSLLCPVLLQIIPDDIALQYSRQRGTSDEWKVSEITEFQQKEILSRERSMHLIKPGNSRDSQSYQKPLKYKTQFKNEAQKAQRQQLHTKQNCVQKLILLHEKTN